MIVLKSIALAQTAQGGGGEGASSPGGVPPILFMIIAMFAIMYFLTIRPNQKREKERQEMLAALSKGDSVITNGGIFGTIIGVNEKSVVLRVSEEPTVKMEFIRGAISRVEKDEGDSE
jgi:preprotein translocase subunit YajC